MRRVGVALLAPLLAFNVLGSCGREQGELCGKPADCATGLTCFAAKCMTPEAIRRIQIQEALKLREAEALAQRERARDTCRNSKACKSLGRCSSDGGKCFVARDEDCREGGAASPCEQFGWCVAVESGDGVGSCIARRDADCERTEACKKFGHCSAIDGSCKVGRDADCQKAEVCTQKGLCGYRNGECVLTDRGCQGLYHCEFYGKCTAFGEKCVATTDSCRRTSACQYAGKCSADLERGCLVRTDADCRFAGKESPCVLKGRCRARAGECVK